MQTTEAGCQADCGPMLTGGKITEPMPPKSSNKLEPTSFKLPADLKKRARRAALTVAMLEGSSLDLTAYVVRALEAQIERDLEAFRQAGGVLPEEK